jgi:23S rRNA pseudouridine1911/1915/1917 synthase
MVYSYLITIHRGIVIYVDKKKDVQKVTVKASDAGERIDSFLAQKTGITRSQIKKLIEKGNVLVDGQHVSRSYRIKASDSVSVRPEETTERGLIPEALPLEIPYRDQHVAVVYKPASMVVYPAAGHAGGTLMNALAYQCERLANVGAPLRPGVVHRLDKDTSGVMVVALSDEAYYDLVSQFRERSIKRRYMALIYGRLRDEGGEIVSKIGRSATDRKKMSTRTKRGKEAVTHWKLLERFHDASLLEVRLGTGRTHQIRVHFASLGHPVLGDRTYGRKTELRSGTARIAFARQMLHAGFLGFIHPVTRKYLKFTCPLPDDMVQKMAELRKTKGSGLNI